MRCLKCNYQSNAKDFLVKNVRTEYHSIKANWNILEIYSERFRICPICKKKFSRGQPRLVREERTVLYPSKVSSDLAKTLKILHKKKKNFSIPDIQRFLKIPIPTEAERILEVMTLSGIIKITYYPPTPRRDPVKRYTFIESAIDLIYESLGERSPENRLKDKLTEINLILSNLNIIATKPQSKLILQIIDKQKDVLAFENKRDNKKVVPSKNYTTYELILRMILYLFNIIEKNRVVSSKQLVKELNIEMKDFINIKSNLEGVLDCNVILYNVLAFRNPMYRDPIPIPIELIEKITHFEIRLRKFIVYTLIEYYTNIKNAYKVGIPSQMNFDDKTGLGGGFRKSRLENHLKKQLANNAIQIKSVESFNVLLEFHNNGVSSLELFEQFMQQTDFNHLIMLIYYLWDNIFSKKFGLLNINQVITSLKVIKDARNTEAHRKFKMIELSKIIESLFIFTKIIGQF